MNKDMNKDTSKFLSRIILCLGVTIFGFQLLSPDVYAQDDSANQDTIDIINEALSDPDSEVSVEENQITIDTQDTQKEENQDVRINLDTGSEDPRVTINAPVSGQELSNPNLLISGLAPAGNLVEILISNEDGSNTSFSRHQGISLSGSVTSDKDGKWAYVPTSDLEDGNYSVYAKAQKDDGSELVSSMVFFTIKNESNRLPLFIIIFLLTLILLVVTLFVFRRKMARFYMNNIVGRKAAFKKPDADKHKKPKTYNKADLNKDGIVDQKDVEQAQTELLVKALKNYDAKSVNKPKKEKAST